MVSDLKFGHFYFLRPRLTSATLEVRWKTSKIFVNFDVEKREDFAWCQQRKVVANSLLLIGGSLPLSENFGILEFHAPLNNIKQ